MLTTKMRVVSVLFTFLSLFISEISCDYWSVRENFIKNEQAKSIGSKIALNRKEEFVNKVLMTHKRKELKKAFLYPEIFSPARHFFEAKSDIDNSDVFKFISKMPKGGALHIHDIALSSLNYVLYNVTYKDNLYACVRRNDTIKLRFASVKPNEDCWNSVKSMRNSAESVDMFDKWLAQKLTLVTDQPYEKYPDINSVWRAFSGLFEVITPMISYKPVFMDYFYNALSEFKNDNVNYVEVRGTLPPVYELNGTSYNPTEVMGILKEVADKFLRDNPDFIGIKYIYAPSRRVDNTTMHEYMKYFKQMNTLYPKFVAGFDLVGQEDLGQPLYSFVNELFAHSKDIKFFFHAGETNWNGMETDLNLIDAILLNTTRIGHGFALLKHPNVLEEIQRRGIAIEVNPISNQVLNLVKDLRNHPVNTLLAMNFPVVISSDDPGLWNALPLSHDFYEAFMGMSSAADDLKMLKQLAYNSLLYSSLSPKEKGAAIKSFNQKWNNFINEIHLIYRESIFVQNM